MKLVLSLFLCCFLLSQTAPQAEAAIKMAATIFPLAAVAREIGGDTVTVTVMLPQGADPHTFEPTPQQMVQFGQTQVLLQVGWGFESWMRKVIRIIKPVHLVSVSEGMVPLAAQHDHHNKHESHRQKNPHTWLDPRAMMRYAQKVATALGDLNPEQKTWYQQRADHYITTLKTLDQQWQQTLKKVATNNFVLFHSAWSYWCRHYQLEPVAVVEEFPGKQPSAKKLISLLKLMKKKQVKAIFADINQNQKLAQMLAKESGIKLLLLDPQGGHKVPGRSSYLELLTYNAQRFEQGLQ